MNASDIIKRLSNNSLFKDSLWAVFGNGIGNFLLLLSGILIARILGKDIYGEYGLVKTTMFHIATFATLGLGFTSTRFIAKYRGIDEKLLRGTIYSSIVITTVTSVLLCVLLICFSVPLAEYLNEPRLYLPFRFLGGIIVVRALATTSNAILAGNKNFNIIGINTIVSGASMLLMSTIFTFFWGLIGSLTALAISQLILCIINFSAINRTILIQIRPITIEKNYSTLLKFTFPVAMQELSYTLSQWGMMLILTKFGSLGEVGLYTASAQWNAIILFIPLLLSNVVLSYLSGASSTKEQERTIKRMLLVNFLATLIPFTIVFLLSDYIISFYGATFHGMKMVMNILIFSTIFDCMCRVFQSNLISEGKNWLLFLFRTLRDSALLISAYYFLAQKPEHAASVLSILNLTICIGYFLLMGIEHILSSQKKNKHLI